MKFNRTGITKIKLILSIVSVGFWSVAGSVEVRSINTYVVPKAKLITYTKAQQPYVLFYPVGWSKDGKFAYFLEERSTPYPDPDPDKTIYAAVIIDAASDGRQVWRYSITKDQELLKDVWLKAGDEPASLEKIWSDFYPMVEPQFIKYNIAQSNLTVHGLPFPGGQKTQFSVTKEFDNSRGHFFVKEATFKLNRKAIHFFRPPVLHVLDIYMSGYIKSPVSNHYAIIFETFRMGQHYERVGPYYYVSGTSLDETTDHKD